MTASKETAQIRAQLAKEWDGHPSRAATAALTYLSQCEDAHARKEWALGVLKSRLMRKWGIK